MSGSARPRAAGSPRRARTGRAAAAVPRRARCVELGSRSITRRASSRAARQQVAMRSRGGRAGSRAAPDWRVPSTSPPPRRRRSSSAMRKPSSVSRMISSRACAVSPSGALVEQQAGRAAGAAADPAAQLVELGEAEALGMLDHHDGGLRHVDADLDHRGRDQDAGLAARRSAPWPRPCRARSCWPCTRPTASPKIWRERLVALLGGGDVERLRTPRPAGKPSRRGRPLAIAAAERARPPRRAARRR